MKIKSEASRKMKNFYKDKRILNKSYISATEEPLNKDALKNYLIENRVLENIEESFYEGIV